MKKLPNSALLELDPAKQSFIKARFGRAGINWIRDFPELVQTCQAQWGLALIGRAEAGLEVNTVFYAQRGDKQCVLKIGLPHPEQLTEIEALRLFSSDKSMLFLIIILPKWTIFHSSRMISNCCRVFCLFFIR